MQLLCSTTPSAVDVLQPCTLAVEKLEWQAPLQVIKYPDPRLRAPNARIGVFDDSLKELARQMFEVMYQ
jgi:peptide deformylase